MIKNKKSLNLNLKVVGATVLILALISGGYAYRENHKKQVISTTVVGEKKLNLNSPTKQEQASGDAIKPNIVQQEEARNNTPANTPTVRSHVVPTITYADQSGNQIEVGGYVNGVFENNGTCTLTIQRAGISKTVSVAATKNVNSVDCPVMSLSTVILPKGSWQAVISYTSNTSEGQSSARSVEVK